MTDAPPLPRRPLLQGCLGPAIFLVALAATWVFLGYRESKRLLPPEGTDTLAKLAAAARPTRKLAVLEDAGRRYFVWIGRTPRIMLASGPPVYVFDASGKLTGRSNDIGDSEDEFLKQLFRLAWESPDISFEDAIKRAKP